ncbi:MFS transporter [Amphritea pacifica]|uniref:MFS transporter n=1 Tax=Amphritea pacifica TaxID=2811233 RepID=A0ABS2W7E9_9GAMM|nr:MFS transporter [Amphritea pacifica]MBN0987640.1 hypothetical protein [Amphritea pacifica]MBN1009054.1 hypothetical protein [Amphritea pacifica]
MKTLAATTMSFGSTLTALSIGSVGLLILGLQPVLLGQLLTTGVVSIEGVGLVAMGEIISLGLGVLLADRYLPLSRTWRIATLASLLIVGFNALACAVHGDLAMTIVRAITGLAEGILVWLTTSIIVRSRHPDRLAALFIVVQTLSQAVVATLLSTAVIPRTGWQGGFMVLACLSLIPGLLARTLPQHLQPLPTQASGGIRWSITTLLPLVIAFLQMAAVGSLWAYLDPVGAAFGFSTDQIGTVVSEVLILQVLGGITATITVRYLNPRLVLFLGSLVLGGIALILTNLAHPSFTTFAMLMALFGFTWLFIMPFHLGLAFMVDSSGRVAVLVPAMQLLGSAIGPLTVSLMMNENNVLVVPLFSGAFALFALSLKLLGHKPLSRQLGLRENPQ